LGLGSDMRAIVLFFLLSGQSTEQHAQQGKQTSHKTKLQIVSSIKPIQAIVIAITGEHAENNQIIPEYASPHNYSFKPSDIRKVKSADVIFRVHEQMETQLNGVFKDLDHDKLIVSLANAEGITLLNFGNSQHNHNSEGQNTHLRNEDFHIWTSPNNAISIAKKIATTLNRIDPKNKQHYAENLLQFTQAVQKEFETARTRLKQHKQRPYVVFHNSWQYLARDLELQTPHVIDVHEGVSKGAKKVINIRSKIKNDNIRCIFYDASINQARLNLFTEGAIINTEEVDVLAKGIEMNQSTYVTWLNSFSKKVESCLSSS